MSQPTVAEAVQRCTNCGGKSAILFKVEVERLSTVVKPAAEEKWCRGCIGRLG